MERISRMLSEELEAISAIYSNEDEVTVLCKAMGERITVEKYSFIRDREYTKIPHVLSLSGMRCSEGDQKSDTIFKIQITCDLDMTQIKVTAVFTLAPEYPDTVPDISVSCEHMTREQGQLMKENIISYAKALIGQPMIMEILLWIQQNISRYITQKIEPTCDSRPSMLTILIHIDHMRSKGRYVKTIEKWVDDLNLSGRLVFHEKLIFLLLQGDKDNIKEYVVRQKTVNIDVDSKGRSCKERMMKIIAEQELDDPNQRISDFRVVEVSTMEDVHDLFTTASLESLYNQYMLPFYKKS